MKHQGQHLGSVEFGLNLAQDFADHFKSQFGAALALHAMADSEVNTLASNVPQTSLVKSGVVRDVFSTGQGQITFSDTEGTAYAVTTQPIEDFAGQTIAVIEIAMGINNYRQAMATAQSTVVLISVVALLIGLVVAVLIGRSVTRPISRATKAMSDIAEGEGDLTQRLSVVGKDELSELAYAFNSFAERVQKTVVEVAQSTDELSPASEEMAAITEDANQRIKQQRQETDQVVTAMNEMTATVQEVASNAEIAASSARDADTNAREGSKVIHRSIEGVCALAKEVDRTAEIYKARWRCTFRPDEGLHSRVLECHSMTPRGDGCCTAPFAMIF